MSPPSRQALSGQECSHIADAIVEVCDLAGSALMFVDEVNRVLQAKDYKKVTVAFRELPKVGRNQLLSFVVTSLYR